MDNEEKLTIRQLCEKTGLSPLAIRARLNHLRKEAKLPKPLAR